MWQRSIISVSIYLNFFSFQNIRHDWYQTEVAVVLTVLVKNVKDNDIEVNFTDASVSINLFVNEEANKLCFNLAHKVVPEQCSYKITPSKVGSGIKTLTDVERVFFVGRNKVEKTRRYSMG